jgi:hypothetical protein
MEGDSERNKDKHIEPIGNMDYDDSPVFQSTGLRRSSILVNIGNWKFVESECRLVLYCGLVLWTIHFISNLI